MKLKNETNLPETIVRVAERLVNSHPKFQNDMYSVTELLKSEKQIVLARRHTDDIEMDVQDTFSMWNGTAIHGLLEESADKDRFDPETRFVLDMGNVKISGGYDLYDTKDNILYDYKTTKVATYQKNVSGSETKWVDQLYVYCKGIQLVHGKRPDKVVVIAMLTDHSKIKAQADPMYPQHPIMKIEWKTDDAEMDAEIISELSDKAERVKNIMESGEEPPKCTYRDCWCTEDYAITKPGLKRALKTFDNAADARSYYDSMEKKSEYRIIHRISNAMNCKNYCQCREFCKQGIEMAKCEAISEDITDYVAF